MKNFRVLLFALPLAALLSGCPIYYGDGGGDDKHFHLSDGR